MLLVYTLGRAMVGIILPDVASYVEDTAVLYLRVNVPFYFFLTVLLELRSTLQGLGHSVIPIVASIIELVWKICTVAFMIPWLEYMGVIVSEPIIWTLCAIVIGIIALMTLRRLPKDDAVQMKGAADDKRAG